MSVNVASQIKFYDLCEVFEATCKLKKQNKTEALSKFINKYKATAKELKEAHADSNISFYPALRLILPHLERERGAYGLKEFTIAKRLIKLLCLAPQSDDAQQLINFRTSSNNVKDFAEAAFWVLRKHFLGAPKLSIEEVNEHLNIIAQKNSDNDPRGVDAQLYKLFQETSSDEQRWILRIILKDMKLGIGQDRVFNLYHPDAVDLFSTNSSLAKVCDILFDSSIRLNEIEVTIFEPFRPMLSQRCDIGQFNKIFTKRVNLYVENKFDGERFQLHMENNQFKYFSRNGYDFTSTYGSNFLTGLYTPLLKNAFHSSVRKIILDGEMMGWNSKTKKFGSKGMAFDVKHLKPNTTYQPCFCTFDILMLNNKTLTNQPLKDRLLMLDSVIKPVHGVIMTSHRKEADTKQNILDALNQSMDNEEEGIVFKDILSCYKSNNRNAGWWKMKLEYFENVMQDLDVLIMGGFYGEGRRHSLITGFLVCVKGSSTDDNNLPVEYLSLAKISSGLSDEELRDLDKKLGPHWKNLTEGDPQKCGLKWGKEKPNVWISPNKSCVLQVRASELIRSFSLDFKTDYILRFPRIQKIRFDKPYYDCLSNDELQELTKSSKAVEKLSKRHLELSDLDPPEKQKKIKKRFANADMKEVEEKSNLLMGHEFCVLTGTEEWKKEDVETAIRENGATVVRNEGTRTLCILIGDDHPRISSSKEYDLNCDLVKLQWLSSVINNGVFSMYSPRDMLHTSKKTRDLFLSRYDKYGDSYLEDATLESIKEIIGEVQNSNDYVRLTSNEIMELEQELNFTNPLRAMKNTIAYFDRTGKNYKTYSSEEPPLSEEIEFKFLGGTVSGVINQNVEVIVMDTSNTLRKQEILEYLQQIDNKTAIIEGTHFTHNKLKTVQSLLK